MFDEGDEEYDLKHDIHKEEGQNRKKIDAQDKINTARNCKNIPTLEKLKLTS